MTELEILIPTDANPDRVLDIVEAALVDLYGPSSPVRHGRRAVEGAEVVKVHPATAVVLIALGSRLVARHGRRVTSQTATFVVRDEWGGVTIRTSGAAVRMQHDVLAWVVEFMRERELVSDVAAQGLLAGLQHD